MRLPRKHLILHIGLHKTGTTSLQKFFLEHRAFYRERGLDYYVSRTRRNNGSEVAYLVLRDGIAGPKGRSEIGDSVDRFFETTESETLLIIGEAFSYLRTAEECERIKTLFSGKADRITIVVVWRDRAEWWASYLNQMRKDDSLGPKPAGETTHLDPEGWLTDFETLRTLLLAHFDDVIEIDYTPTIITTFCSRLGLAMPPEAAEYKVNVRENLAARRVRAFPKRFYKRYLADTIVGRAKRALFQRRGPEL